MNEGRVLCWWGPGLTDLLSPRGLTGGKWPDGGLLLGCLRTPDRRTWVAQKQFLGNTCFPAPFPQALCSSCAHPSHINSGHLKRARLSQCELNLSSGEADILTARPMGALESSTQYYAGRFVLARPGGRTPECLSADFIPGLILTEQEVAGCRHAYQWLSLAF